MADPDNFSHAATVLPVKNVEQSVAFYSKKLGFTVTFTWEEPMSYAVLKKGSVSIHLVKKDDHHTPSKKHCALYIFVHNVDDIYQICVNEKIPMLNMPETRDYKMKDFDIVDPDGYIITFGNGS